jgi:hypothetical protein
VTICCVVLADRGAPLPVARCALSCSEDAAAGQIAGRALPQHAARPLDLQSAAASSSLRCVSDDAATLVWGVGRTLGATRLCYRSLADVFPETPGLATAFGTDVAFRQALRAGLPPAGVSAVVRSWRRRPCPVMARSKAPFWRRFSRGGSALVGLTGTFVRPRTFR